jgi:hypothetical protein
MPGGDSMPSFRCSTQAHRDFIRRLDMVTSLTNELSVDTTRILLSAVTLAQSKLLHHELRPIELEK